MLKNNVREEVTVMYTNEKRPTILLQLIKWESLLFNLTEMSTSPVTGPRYTFRDNAQ